MSHTVSSARMAQKNNDLSQTSQSVSVSHRDLFSQLLEAVQLEDQSQQQRLFGMIQDRKSAQQIRASLDVVLAIEGLSHVNNELSSRPNDATSGTCANKNGPISCPRILDIPHLCRTAPYRVPAKPWTTVTDSDCLVSHLVSLYLTWGYPFYAFFCRETFLRHMSSGKLNSDFCSPFLVNALLANACFYSDYLEAYSLPGDVKRKGAEFLAEAESHLRTCQFENGHDIRLSSLQAILLLYERYSLTGQDNYGYIMLNRAISMAESMGIVNNSRKMRVETSEYSTEMERSLKRTAWGLFQIDTIVHVNFLKNSHIKTVNLDRISRTETEKTEFWMPYPLQGPPRRSYMSLYFDEACKLSYIARDASWEISRAYKDEQRVKHNLISRLSAWERNLPDIFKTEQMPASYVLILRMRYLTLIINICCHDVQNDISSVKIDEQTPHFGQSSKVPAATKTAVSSAREIAFIVETFKEQYGLEHSHQFAMYAINVSLFCLLTQADFNLFDRDFLSLTEAFSIVAYRSQVGRHLFHAFKVTIRKSIQAAQGFTLDIVPPAMKEFFEPREYIHEPDKWDRYAAGLAEADGDRNFLEDLEMNPIVPSLNDMLHWYEHLSIGRETERRRASHKPDF